MSDLSIQDAATAWLSNLEHRKRNPAKASSLATFSNYVRTHILPATGSIAVASFGNREMRDFVARLAEKGLRPKTIQEVAGTLKQVVASVIDPNTGDALYPRQWNPDFIDAPIVTNQNQPTVDSSAVENAIGASDAATAVLIALAAASGARIGELRALRVTPTDSSVSHWNETAGTLEIRTSLWNGIEQSPKTSSAIRTIELAAPVNDMLKTFVAKRVGFIFGNGVPTSLSTLRSHLDAVLPSKGFHSLRRFRAVVLRRSGVAPTEIVKYWLGHSNGSTDITERYSKSLAEDEVLRRKLSDEVGTGFRVPSIAA